MTSSCQNLDYIAVRRWYIPSCLHLDVDSFYVDGNTTFSHKGIYSPRSSMVKELHVAFPERTSLIEIFAASDQMLLFYFLVQTSAEYSQPAENITVVLIFDQMNVIHENKKIFKFIHAIGREVHTLVSYSAYINIDISTSNFVIIEAEGFMIEKGEARAFCEAHLGIDACISDKDIGNIYYLSEAFPLEFKCCIDLYKTKGLENYAKTKFDEYVLSFIKFLDKVGLSDSRLLILAAKNMFSLLFDERTINSTRNYDKNLISSIASPGTLLCPFFSQIMTTIFYKFSMRIMH